ncbi:MYND-type domain-containing protein [Mycena chlorophos]|uniref:MYND-type domain-containing protein n=1 Tax=Mycena chlorophos TaxID=658473 RepID=A0A8H6S3W4_MYCCL|nr:MYND-type domain-containing protein [Mycena chlorophos]
MSTATLPLALRFSQFNHLPMLYKRQAAVACGEGRTASDILRIWGYLRSQTTPRAHLLYLLPIVYANLLLDRLPDESRMVDFDDSDYATETSAKLALLMDDLRVCEPQNLAEFVAGSPDGWPALVRAAKYHAKLLSKDPIAESTEAALLVRLIDEFDFWQLSPHRAPSGGAYEEALDSEADRCRPIGDFGRAVVKEQFVKAMTRSLVNICQDPAQPPRSADDIGDCLPLLDRAFSDNYDAHLPAAIGAGLLVVVARSALKATAERLTLRHYLLRLLEVVLPRALCSRRVVDAIRVDRANNGISHITGTTAFKRSEIGSAWVRFMDLFDDCCAVLVQLQGETDEEQKACDNPLCLKIDAKAGFGRCKCGVIVYCSSSCQAQDWERHRGQCGSTSKSIYLVSDGTMHRSERAFLRALVDHHYRQHKAEIMAEQVRILATRPGGAGDGYRHCVVHFDYTVAESAPGMGGNQRGNPRITVDLAAQHADDADSQEIFQRVGIYLPAFAESADRPSAAAPDPRHGRIDIHMVSFPWRHIGVRRICLPLRSGNAAVFDGVRALVERCVAQGWDDERVMSEARRLEEETRDVLEIHC